MPHMPEFINNTDKDFSSLIELANTFFPFAQEQLGFSEPVTIILMSDEENAANDLGKTGFYDPEGSSIGLYTDNRHPKDILRSLAHELVHHMQNGAGMFDGAGDLGPGYAQKDEHMREMEREAYEKGNMCFRDWEDKHKAEISKWELKESIRRELKKRLVETLPGTDDEEESEGPTGAPPESITDRPVPGEGGPGRLRRFASAVGDVASNVAQRGREFHQGQLGTTGPTSAGTYLSPAPRSEKGKVDFQTSARSAGWDRDEEGNRAMGPRQPHFSDEEQTGFAQTLPPKLGDVLLTKDSEAEMWADWIMSFEDVEIIKKAFYTMLYDAVLEDNGKPIKLSMKKKLEIGQHYVKKMYGPGGPAEGEAPAEESAEVAAEAEVEGTIGTEPSIEGSTMDIERDPSASVEDIEAADEADLKGMSGGAMDPSGGIGGMGAYDPTYDPTLDEGISLENELKLRSVINEAFAKMKNTSEKKKSRKKLENRIRNTIKKDILREQKRRMTLLLETNRVYENTKPSLLVENTGPTGAPVGDLLANYDRPDAQVLGRNWSDDRSERSGLTTRSVGTAGAVVNQETGQRKRDINVGDYHSEYSTGDEWDSSRCRQCSRERDPALGWLHHMENFDDGRYADNANRYRAYMRGEVELDDEELARYDEYEQTFADAWYAEYRANNDYHRERNARSYGFENWGDFMAQGGADLFTVSADDIADASPWVRRDRSGEGLSGFFAGAGEYITDWAERQEFGGGWDGVNDRRSRAGAYSAAGDPRFDTTVNPNLPQWKAEQNMLMYGITPQYQDMPDGSRRVIAPTGDEVRREIRDDYISQASWYQKMSPLYHLGAGLSLYDAPLMDKTVFELGSEVTDFNTDVAEIGLKTLAMATDSTPQTQRVDLGGEYDAWLGAGQHRPGTAMDQNMAFMTNQYDAQGNRIEGAWRNIPGAQDQANRSLYVPDIYQAIGLYYGGRALYGGAWGSATNVLDPTPISTALKPGVGTALKGVPLYWGTSGMSSRGLTGLDPGRSGYGGSHEFWGNEGFIFADNEDLSLMAQPGGWAPEAVGETFGSNEDVNPWEDPREARIARSRDPGGQSGQMMNDIRTAEYGVSLDALYRNQRSLESVLIRGLEETGAGRDITGVSPLQVGGEQGEVPEFIRDRPQMGQSPDTETPLVGDAGREPIDFDLNPEAGGAVDPASAAVGDIAQPGRAGYSDETINAIHRMAGQRVHSGNYSLPTDPDTGHIIDNLPVLQLTNDDGTVYTIDPYERPQAWWREMENQRIDRMAAAVETATRGGQALGGFEGDAGWFGMIDHLQYIVTGMRPGREGGVTEFETRQEYLRGYYYDQYDSHLRSLTVMNGRAPEDQRLEPSQLEEIAQQRAVGDTTLRRVLTPYSEFERDGTFNPLGQFFGDVEGRESAAWDADVMVTNMLQDPSARDMILQQGMGKVFQLAWDYGFTRNNPEYLETILPGERYAPVRQALATMAYEKAMNMQRSLNGEEVNGVTMTSDQIAQAQGTTRAQQVAAIQWTQFGLNQGDGSRIGGWINSSSMVRTDDGTGWEAGGSLATGNEVARLRTANREDPEGPSGVFVGRQGSTRNPQRELTNAEAYDQSLLRHGEALVEAGRAYLPRPTQYTVDVAGDGSTRWHIPQTGNPLVDNVNLVQADGTIGFRSGRDARHAALRNIALGNTGGFARIAGGTPGSVQYTAPVPRSDRQVSEFEQNEFELGLQALQDSATTAGGNVSGRAREGGDIQQGRPTGLEEGKKSRKHKLLKENKTMKTKDSITREQLEKLVRSKIMEKLQLNEQSGLPQSAGEEKFQQLAAGAPAKREADIVPGTEAVFSSAPAKRESNWAEKGLDQYMKERPAKRDIGTDTMLEGETATDAERQAQAEKERDRQMSDVEQASRAERQPRTEHLSDKEWYEGQLFESLTRKWSK